MCDQISDAILDYCLAYDKKSRVAIECLASERTLIIAGEVTTNAILTNPVILEIAKRKIKDIGYDDPSLSFSYDDIEVGIFVHSQSPDIALGVDKGGAGDQGMMFGYATNENKQYMPYPIYLANKLSNQLYTLFKEKKLEKVILFGSRARNEYKDNSDSDLAVIFNNNDNDNYIKLFTKLEDLNTLYKFDVIDFNKITNNKLKNEIIKDGICIHKI